MFIVSIIDEWTGREHRWNNTDREKPKYSEENLFHCSHTHHKFHVYLPRTEHKPALWLAGNKPPQLRHGQIMLQIGSEGLTGFQTKTFIFDLFLPNLESVNKCK
jgi:hypothetical protein